MFDLKTVLIALALAAGAGAAMFLLYKFAKFLARPVVYPYDMESCPEKGKAPTYASFFGISGERYVSRHVSSGEDSNSYVSCSGCGFSMSDAEMRGQNVDGWPLHP